MNMNDLESFVIKMLEEHPDYKNRIITIYSQCSTRIIKASIEDDKNFSREDEINNCIKSIKKLLNA